MAAHPLWAKAPLVLLRWPAILSSIAAGALLLGVTAASPPLFLSSSATDALDRSIAESTRFRAGMTIALRDRRVDVLAGEDRPVSTVDARDRVLARATATIPHLDRRILTILGDPVAVSSRTAPSRPANPVRIVFRNGAFDHLREIAGGGNGAWIQDVTAEALRVGPGDYVTLTGDDDRRARLQVAGIYEALANSPPDPFWEPLAEEFRPPAVDAPLPPPFVLVDRPTADDAFDRLGEREAEFQWEFPLAPDAPLELTSATELADDFAKLDSALRDELSPYGRYFHVKCPTCVVPVPIRLDFRSTLEQDIGRARETAGSLRPSIELLAIAGLLTALVVLGAAGLYAVNRRRTEMRFLAARGMSPAVLGAKAALESALPLLAGAAAGLVGSVLLLERLGPGDELDPAAVADAARSVALVVPPALALIGVAAAISVSRLSALSISSRAKRQIPWELPVLAAAAVALWQLREGDALVVDASSDVESVSLWLLAFPVLFVGATAGLVARGFRRVLLLARTRERRARPPLYLALNRLATARWLAIMLISASALAFGILLYAETMAASVRKTTIAKSYVFTGSDVSIPVDRQYSVPESFPWPYTMVSSKLDAGRVQPTNETVDFLAVDVSSFEDAAFWDESFSQQPLDELLRALAKPSTGALRVIVAGDLPPGAALELGGVPVPFEVVARVDTFPGQFLDRTLMVVNRETVGTVIEAAGGLDPVTAAGSVASLWIKGSPDGIVASLGDLGFGPNDSLSAAAVLHNPSFIAVTRTFGFLQALGALAGLLVLVGIVLYLQTRQRARTVAYALARKMGLRARSHFAALVLELGAMLALSLVTGAALGTAAARLVYDRVDLLPNIPPHPLFRIPLGAALPVTVALVLTTSVGALRAHRAAEHADVAGALRSGA